MREREREMVKENGVNEGDTQKLARKQTERERMKRKKNDTRQKKKMALAFESRRCYLWRITPCWDKTY